MSVITVKTGTPYPVKIEAGLIDRAGEECLRAFGRPCAVGLISDDTVNGLYGQRVRQSLESSGFTVYVHAFAHGEKSKDLACWGEMLNFLAANRLTRSDGVVALGGGVTGDMAGFAAACYLRGVPFVQIPTTLLAMVDSSVGGKTGVDLPAGKNLAGAFYQPRAVLCDPEALATLPRPTLLDGVAESVKYGVLNDPALFELFEGERWREKLPWVIEQCVGAKAALVERDERDTGSRQLLNLGHTLGHGLERLSGYTLSHGYAVAIGMVDAARLSWRLGYCEQGVLTRISAALSGCGLPVKADYPAAALCDSALSDKKRMGDTLTFVLPEAIGRCRLEKVTVAELPRWIALAVED